MNAYEYLNALRAALSSLPDEEIDSAMRYYEDYFLDAGEENADRVIAELGDPQKVAQDILNDYGGIARSTARTGASTGSDGVSTADEYARQQKRRVKGVSPWVLALLVLIGLPVGIPLLLGAGGVLIGVLAAIVGVLIAAVVLCAALPFALCASGLVLSVFAFLVLSTPASALLTLGVGLTCLAAGILLAALILRLCVLFVPPLVRGFVALLRWPIDRLRGVRK